jgi:hypothetical protein
MARVRCRKPRLPNRYTGRYGRASGQAVPGLRRSLLRGVLSRRALGGAQVFIPKTPPCQDFFGVFSANAAD